MHPFRMPKRFQKVPTSNVLLYIITIKLIYTIKLDDKMKMDA
jgi:hypothetical protein